MGPRTLDQLINRQEPAWPLVQEWIAAARNPVEVLPGTRTQGERTLLSLQVTTRSPMGAIALESGGILIDHGWLRILGSGSERMRGSLLTWNGQGDDPVQDPVEAALMIGHDAVGGFFALNGGAFEGSPGSVYYFASDSLNWENLELSYSRLLIWALQGDLASFYANTRWPGWEEEVAGLTGDQGMSIWPPLWSNGEPIADRGRRRVPMAELWGMQREMARQLQGLPNGTRVRLSFDEDPPNHHDESRT